MNKFMLILILNILISNTTQATDRLYLQCDPEANCVVQVIRLLGKKIIVENPVCVAARAACRLKCKNLNDDADRYIGEFESKKGIASKQILELQINLAQFQFQKSQTEGGIARAEKLNELLVTFLTMNQQNLQLLIELNQLLNSIQSNQIQSLAELNQIMNEQNLSNELKQLLSYWLIVNQANEKGVMIQLKKLEIAMNNPYIMSNLLSEFEQLNAELKENLEFLIEQISVKESQLQDQKDFINKLNNQIQEQKERKCPENLI